MSPAPSQEEAFARIRLLRSPNIGPISYRQLLQRFGTARAALEALPDLGARGTREYRPARASAIEAEIAAVRKAGARYLFHDAPDYPALLGMIESAPPILTTSAAGSSATRKRGLPHLPTPTASSGRSRDAIAGAWVPSASDCCSKCSARCSAAIESAEDSH